MIKYDCIICKFKTVRKNDYSRHIKSKKHLEKVSQCIIPQVTTPDISSTLAVDNKVFICPNCKNTFTRGSSLSRHKKTCMEIIINDKSMDNLKKENERLQKQVETYENMLKSITTPQTINYFNYICMNYPNTPALESAPSHDNMIEESMTLIEVVSMYYYDDKLVSFLGDYVIGLYKKDKPMNQSIWTTDVSRLTYIISARCIQTKKNIWSYDKKASKTKEIAIAPALQFIRDGLYDYCQENGGNTEKHVLKYMIAANDTIQLIDNGKLASDIAKYIAPKFVVTQGDSQAIVKV